jgi:hypothetical protein
MVRVRGSDGQHDTGSEQRAGDLWNGLHSSFLAALDDDQKLRIFDLTTRASRALHRWAARYPLIRRVRVWPVSLSVSAATPFASAAALISIARMSLWVFTIDDLFDEEMVPVGELRRRSARYNDILAGKHVDHQERDTLALALQDIYDDLERYPLFLALRDHWAEAVARTLEAMLREHEWRARYRATGDVADLPSYETYLSYGLYSIGGPPHFSTTLIALDDASVLNRLQALKELEHTASICLRLANDLASYAKEIAEGKINALVIQQQQRVATGILPEPALSAAYDLVHQDLQLSLQRCDQLQHQATTGTGHPERAIADIARFVTDFYIHHDYHTFSAGTGRSG